MNKFILMKPDDPDEWPGWNSVFDEYVGTVFVIDVSKERMTSNGRPYYQIADIWKDEPTPDPRLKISSKWLVDLSQRLSWI